MKGTATKRGAVQVQTGLRLVLTLALALAVASLGQPAAGQTASAPTSVALTGLAETGLAPNAKPTASSRRSRTVVVSVLDRQLAVVENGSVIARFPVAVGAVVSPSPRGKFQIVSRVVNPTYYHSGAVIPSGKNNPVGTRWLGLSQKGYGIHGTNAPKSVGHAASHGCIRLRNRDVERLFTLLRVGDAVEIRGERDEQTARIFQVDGGAVSGSVAGSAGDDATVAAAQAPAQSGGQDESQRVGSSN